MQNIVFVIALAIISSTSFGQKVNFSGTWKINTSKSELGDQFSLAPDNMVLKHTKKSLELERSGSMQGEDYTLSDAYTLDGEECENPGWMGPAKKSTATFDKKTKVLKINSKIPLDDGGEVELTEEIVMDGDNLVIESSAYTDYGDLVERFVFDKE
ncbi:MAG: hypothetical protein MUO43_02620 [Desulfobacterales bacterium]|nr:hypothetical protein [Desulfobacterales bacterium]